MSKYTIPSPEDYMSRLYNKLVIAKLTGDTLEANKNYTYMSEFTECMRRSGDYHQRRVRG